MNLDILKKVLNNSNKKYLIFVIVGFLLMILIMLSETDFESNEKLETSETNLSSLEYLDYLENKLTNIIESIDGAGKTEVMITLSETYEYIYAKNDKNSNKITDKTSDKDYDGQYVIIEQNNNDMGLLVKVIEPKIRGVAVVCEGADDPVVQNNIYTTVSAVLNISTARISISKSEAKEK